MVYIGSVIDLFKRYLRAAVLSCITRCVNFDEKGKVMAFTFSVDSISMIIMTQVCPKIIYKIIYYTYKINKF